MAVPRERIWWLCPKRVKQHLRIKALYGTSENAVKARNRVAITVYVLMAITRERLGLEASFYATLQILSVTLFRENAHFTGLPAIHLPSDTTACSEWVECI